MLKKIEYPVTIQQVAAVLSLGSLRSEFYTVQNLIVVGATVFSKNLNCLPPNESCKPNKPAIAPQAPSV